MATTLPTLPLFGEPATPSTKRWPDDKRGSASDEERQEHVNRLRSLEYRCVSGHDKCSEMYPGPECPYCERVPGKLSFGDPVADLRKPWWETMTEADSHSFLQSLADEIKRNEREALQAQSLAADLDPFEDDPFAELDDKFWDSAERRADDRW